ATVGKRIGVLLAREQRIERNGNNPGAHRSQERDRIVRRVVKNEENTILLANPQFSQRRAKPVGFILHLAIAERTPAVVESNLFAETARNIPIDQVGGSVVWTALQEIFEHWQSRPVFSDAPYISKSARLRQQCRRPRRNYSVNSQAPCPSSSGNLAISI